MKPVLIVEGKRIEIYAMFYREGKVQSVSFFDESGVAVTYHDASEDMQYYTEKPLQIDFSKYLKWEGRYEPIKLSTKC